MAAGRGRDDRDGAPASERAYRALGHRDYRVLWAGQFASTLGTRVQQVAIAWQVYLLTGSALQLGLLGLVRFVPIALFGIMGGVVADRGDRRRTLLLSQVALLLSSAMLALMTLTNSASIGAIYAVTFLSAAVGTVAGPTYQALVPALVDRRHLPGAMTMNILASQVAAVSGPALGGAIIARFGIAPAYGMDALSFGAVIAALLAMRLTPRLPGATTLGLAAALEGLRFLRRSPALLGVMTVDFLATFFGASTVLMPIFTTRVFGVGAAGLGLLLAAPAAGAVVASVVMGGARTARRPGAGVLVAVAVYGVCLLGFGLSRELWLSLAFLAGSGGADAVSMALRHTLRNLATPDTLRGRIAAAHATFAMGGPQLGEFEAGAAAALLGAGPAVAIGGLGTLVTVAIVARRVPAIAAYRFTADPAGAACRGLVERNQAPNPE